MYYVFVEIEITSFAVGFMASVGKFCSKIDEMLLILWPFGSKKEHTRSETSLNDNKRQDQREKNYFKQCCIKIDELKCNLIQLTTEGKHWECY